MNNRNEKLFFWLALISAIGTVIQTALALADHVATWLEH